jgi:osmotically-inducible protein OsmY
LEKNVTFSIDDGHMQLTGTVRNPWAKSHIQEDIERFLSIKNVTNALAVEPDQY